MFKPINYFMLCCMLVLNGCTNKNVSIVNLIDINKWGEITILSLKDELNLNTELKYIDDTCCIGCVKRFECVDMVGFEQGIKNRLCFRNEIIELLHTRSISSNVRSIHIKEKTGFDSGGYFINVSIYVDKKYDCHIYYNPLTDGFVIKDVERYDCSEFLDPLEKEPMYLSEVEDSLLSDFSLVTLIKKEKSSDDLSYRIVSAYAR